MPVFNLNNGHKVNIGVVYQLKSYDVMQNKHCGAYYDLYIGVDIIYKTLREAEEYIKLSAGDKDTIAFYIYERPFKSDWIYSIRTFAQDGSLLNHSELPPHDFHGRNKKDCRFTPGDIIAEFMEDKIRILIVCEQPLTEEDVILFKQKYPDVGLDWDDDRYIAIDQHGNKHHVRTPYCLPTASIPMDEQLQNKLRERFKEYIERNEESELYKKYLE